MNTQVSSNQGKDTLVWPGSNFIRVRPIYGCLVTCLKKNIYIHVCMHICVSVYIYIYIYTAECILISGL